MSRRDDLERLLVVAWDSLEECEPDKRSPLIGQVRAILAELDGPQVVPVEVERTGLLDFQEAIAKRRQSGADAAGGR